METPSEKYHLPVIGKITTKITGVKINNQPYESETDTFDVIKVIENHDNSKTYICNVWYKEDTPQLVHEMFVTSFEEK